MVLKEKKYSKNYSKELLSIAFADFESAQDLMNAKTKRVENIFLLAQQALEKALKAVICWYEMPIPFLHDIGILVTLISKIAMPPFAYSLNQLSEFAAIRRYHEGHEEFTEDEIKNVLQEVHLAILWCRAKIE